MKLGSASSVVQDLPGTLDAVCSQAAEQLGGAPAELALVHFTSHFEDEAPAMVRLLRGRFPAALLAGCSAEGVVGDRAEHERVPAVSVLLAHLPGTHLKAVRADAAQLGTPVHMEEWLDGLGPGPGEEPSFLLFADPFSVPIADILDRFNRRHPRRPVLGGMVSGCEGPGQSVLILNDAVYRDGAVAIAFTGRLMLRPVVSQGCRPVGERFVITRARDNVIQQLGGKPALQQLRDQLKQMSGDDLVLAQHSLFVGLAINEYREQFRRGDFVIRHLLAADPNSGAIAVGDKVRVGASMQFHVRDERSADEDLREMLRGAGVDRPAGALLYTCNGRGTRMWAEPNHDVAVLQECCGPVPVGGFFAAGELGPIDGRNYIHGHTASIGLFCDREESRKME
jgi:small ligand-binding sensory domain FIST